MKGIVGKRFFPFAVIVALMLVAAGCGSDDEAVGTSDPANPWTATAVSASWLDNNPYADTHDGGWVYSAREDRLYAMYGNDDSGRVLYRINHINNSSSVATTFLGYYHGAQPVIDDTGTCIYMTPGYSDNTFERYNTVTDTRETLPAAPAYGYFSHGAWKAGKFWVVLDDLSLYSFNPADNTWSGALQTFSNNANVATSGPGSNRIYILEDGGNFQSYDVVTDNVMTLESYPNVFDLGGNAQLTWFGVSTGFIYARESASLDNGAIFDISAGTWHQLTDPKVSDNYDGHATYDSSRRRLYFTSYTDPDYLAWYYQF